MKDLIRRWAQLDTRFLALTRRERGSVAFALAVGGGFLLFNFLVDPYLARARQSSKLEVAAQTELTQLQTQALSLAGKANDPDEPNRQRLANVRKEIAGVSERLAVIESRLVPPARMRSFLEGVLAKNPGVELLGLRTLPVMPMDKPLPTSDAENVQASSASEQLAREPEKTASTAATPGLALKRLFEDEGLYKHGIEVRLAGSYNELLGYLVELERLPQRVMWHSVSLSVERYPRNVMVLRVYTLSLDKKWLAI